MLEMEILIPFQNQEMLLVRKKCQATNSAEAEFFFWFFFRRQVQAGDIISGRSAKAVEAVQRGDVTREEQ